MKRVFYLIVIPLLIAFPMLVSATFTDSENHWASDQINKGVKLGIIQEYADTFKPDDTITVGEFEAFLLRAYMQEEKTIVNNNENFPLDIGSFMKKMNYPYDETILEELSRYQMAELITSSQGLHYNRENAVKYLIVNDLTKGKTEPTVQGFKGEELLTRAEAVIFLNRLIDKDLNKEILLRPNDQTDTEELEMSYQRHLKENNLGRLPSNIKIDVPLILQQPELDRGCEVTSLAMLLQFDGVEIDKLTLAKEIKKVPFEENGLRGNMNEGFVGNMYTFNQPGLGVYHDPIMNLGLKYSNNLLDISGEPFEKVLRFLANGKPVWVISTSTFTKLPEYHFQIWNTHAGEMKVTYKEHSVVLTGYDENFIYINDPLHQKKNRKIDRIQFKQGWEQMGSQAITFK